MLDMMEELPNAKSLALAFKLLENHQYVVKEPHFFMNPDRVYSFSDGGGCGFYDMYIIMCFATVSWEMVQKYPLLKII